MDPLYTITQYGKHKANDKRAKGMYVENKD